jgi:hypothetical protein
VTDHKAPRDRRLQAGVQLLARLRTRVGSRLVAGPGGEQEQPSAQHPRLAARVAALEDAVEENRRLNQRLADVVDVVTEVLVPAADRDDARLRAALKNLNRTLEETPADDDR